MAKVLATFSPRLATFTVVAVLFLACCGATAAAGSERPRGFLQRQGPAPKLGPQKLSHFRVYWHDILSGRNPTAEQVAQAAATKTSSTAFGVVFVIDDPLTEGPELSSKLVGRAQGMYASASQSGSMALMMAMNFAFMEGKYNGSTITILGRNSIFSAVREMPVIGGSGLFRFARGYCQARTHKADLRTRDAVVEYNIFVMHY